MRTDRRTCRSNEQRTPLRLRKVITGRVRSGEGDGERYTSLSWFRRAISRSYGFDPYPGTLNIEVSPFSEVQNELVARGTVLVPPTTGVCCSLLRPASLGKARRRQIAAGAGGKKRESVVIVRPLLLGYEQDKIELVSPAHLRLTLGLSDADEVELEFDRKTPSVGGWIQG